MQRCHKNRTNPLHQNAVAEPDVAAEDRCVVVASVPPPPHPPLCPLAPVVNPLPPTPMLTSSLLSSQLHLMLSSLSPPHRRANLLPLFPQMSPAMKAAVDLPAAAVERTLSPPPMNSPRATEQPRSASAAKPNPPLHGSVRLYSPQNSTSGYPAPTSLAPALFRARRLL